MVRKPLRRSRKRQGKAKQAASSPAAGKPGARQSVVRRTVVPPKKRPELLSFLEKKLAEPDFFECLESLHGGGRVKRFVFQGIPVIIKNTVCRGEYNHLHGKDFERLRAAFLAHQKALRAGKIKASHYRLRSAKAYGMIGDYLIVEYVTHTKGFLTEDALGELLYNFRNLKEKGLIREIPQLQYMLSLKKSTGKETVFLPYDYA